jgi:death-on-curing family protein
MAPLWPTGDPIAPGEYCDFALLDSATARPFQTAFGQEIHPTVIEKAAALFHSLNSNHAFHNGNKRTAVLAFDLFLAANGYCGLLGNEQMFKLAESTASYRERGISHDESLQEILATIKDFVIPLELVKKQTHRAGVAEFYAELMRVRRSVRRNKLNTLMRNGAA